MLSLAARKSRLIIPPARVCDSILTWTSDNDGGRLQSANIAFQGRNETRRTLSLSLFLSCLTLGRIRIDRDAGSTAHTLPPSVSLSPRLTSVIAQYNSASLD